MDKLTVRQLLEKLHELPEEKLDLPLYAWGCQQCAHPITNIDLDDRAGPNVPVVMFEIDSSG